MNTLSTPSSLAELVEQVKAPTNIEQLLQEIRGYVLKLVSMCEPLKQHSSEPFIKGDTVKLNTDMRDGDFRWYFPKGTVCVIDEVDKTTALLSGVDQDGGRTKLWVYYRAGSFSRTDEKPSAEISSYERYLQRFPQAA